MEVNKQIVICSQCKYFPTQVDQLSFQYYEIDQKSIAWNCKACKHKNIFPKKEYIMLSDQYCLRVPVTTLITNAPDQQLVTLCFMFGNLNPSFSRKQVYCIPGRKDLLETELGQCLDGLYTRAQMQQQSQWMRIYCDRKGSWIKLRGIKQKSNRKIYLDQYLIYLMHRYIKKKQFDITESSKNTILEVEIILNNYQNKFHLYPDIHNKQFDHFINFYLHLTLLQNTSQPQRPQNTKKYSDLQKPFQEIILLGFQQILVVKNILNQQDIEKIITNYPQKIDNISSNFKTSEFSIDPLSLNSFFISTKQKKKEKEPFIESIIIFGSRRRSKNIDRIILKQNIGPIKQLLKQKQSSQEEIKKIISSSLQSIIGNVFLKLIKLVGHFQCQGTKTAFLYTFDWNKLSSKKQEVTLEEPLSYRDIIREEDVCPQVQKVNPFAKKRRVQEVNVIPRPISQRQKDQNDFISL